MIDCASLAFSANVADKSLQVCVSHPLSHAMPYPSSPNRIRWEEACLQRRGSLWIGARPDIFDWRTPWISSATGVRFSRCRMPKCRLHARSSWCGMQGFVVVPRFDLESCGSCGMINLWMLAWWPEGIALVLTLELGPWVDQELPGTKNKLRNATVLVIVDSLAFRVLFFSMERIWNLRWTLSVFPFCHTNSQVFFLMIFGCLTRLTELGDS